MTHTSPHSVGLLNGSGPGAAGEELLRRGTELVDPMLREAVDRLHPSVAAVCRYHLGWDSGDSPASVSWAGKRARAALALLSVRSVGAPERFAAVAGTAVELVHELSLLHDDIMDGDTKRRGRVAAWARFGTGAAVLAGDALVVQAVTTVVRAQAPGAGAATEDLAVTVEQMVYGQAEDLALEHRPVRETSESQYVRMARGKTGALFGCAAALGAVLADAPPLVVGALRTAGSELGVAFQILDDVLGLWGESSLTGKPVGADLIRGKKTLPLVLAAASGTADGLRVADLLDSAPLSPDRIPEVMRLLEATGCREYAKEAVGRHMSSALAALEEAGNPGSVRQQWQALIDCLSHRRR